MGAVNTPVLGLYPFPTFVMTIGNTRVPLFQEALEYDIVAVNPILWDTSTKSLIDVCLDNIDTCISLFSFIFLFLKTPIICKNNNDNNNNYNFLQAANAQFLYQSINMNVLLQSG